MRTLRLLTALSVPLLLAVSAEAGRAEGKGKKAGGFRGVVTAVTRDAGKDAGRITVKLHARKKAASSEAPAEKTFQVTPATKFEFVTGAKGSRQVKPATFADLKDGQHVVVRSRGDEAAGVRIIQHGKKKPAK
jgi:hypothetical protein